MGVSVTVRDLPREVRDTLAARAAASGRSLQEYLTMQLTALASRPSLSEALDQARARARAYPPLVIADVISDIEADRR